MRMLSVLQVIFVRPLEREELLTSTELAAVFPNLDEITEMHSKGCCKEAFVNTARQLNIAPFLQRICHYANNTLPYSLVKSLTACTTCN